MKTDRELLELAAKAAGYKVNKNQQSKRDEIIDPATACLWVDSMCTAWNSLRDGGNALCLAADLHFQVTIYHHCIVVSRLEDGFHDEFLAQQPVVDGDIYAATFRAITRAAAAIGEKMP